jgi:hypothetical protein
VSEFPQNDGKNAVPLRIIAQILIFFALIGLGLLFLWPIQRAIYGGMIGIRDNLIGRMETFIGRTIRYSSISPSILGAFDIRNVRIMGDDALPVLSISRFRISYSLFALLRGKPDAIRSVGIDTPLIDADLERDRDLIEFLRSLEKNWTGRGNSVAQFPERLQIRIRNGHCLLLDKRNQYEIEALNLNAQIDNGRFTIDGKWLLGFSVDRLIGEPLRTELEMGINGSGSAQLDQGNAVLTIPSVNGDLMEMRSLAFNLDLQNSVISLTKPRDRLPFDFSLTYGIPTGDAAIRFSCDQFLLKDLVVFSEEWKGGNRWLDIASSGVVSFDRGGDGTVKYRVDLSGDVPQADLLRSAAADALFEIRASGDEKTAGIEAFRFFMPRPAEISGGEFYGDISFTGTIGLDPIAPNGSLSLSGVSLTGQENLSAELAINTHGREISIFGETVSMGQTDLTALNASLVPSLSGFSFIVSALRFRDMDSYDNVRLGSFSLEGSVDSQSRQIDASLLLDAFSAGDIADMARPFVQEPLLSAPLRGIWRNLSITTEIFFTTDFEHLLYNAPRLVVAYEGGRGMVGLISVSGTDHRFELSEGRFIWDKDVLLLAGRAEFPKPGEFSFSMNAGYQDFSYYLNGQSLGPGSISVQGSHGIQARLNAAAAGYSGYVQGQDIPIPYRGHPARISFFSSLRYVSPSSWSVDVDRIEIADIASAAGPARLRLEGRADQNGALFPLLHYSDSLGPLDGSADISWAEDFSRFSGMVNIEQGQERYRIEGSLQERRLEMLISGSRMRLDRIFDQINTAFADGDIRISWDSVQSFRAEFNLASLSAKIREQEFRLSARALMDSGEFTVKDMRFNFAGLEGDIPLLSINAAEGFAHTRAEISGFAGGKKLAGALVLEAGFKPIGSWLEIGDILGSFNGLAHVENMQYAGFDATENFNINISRSNGALSVTGGPRDMLRLQIDRDGNFYAGLSSPFPVRGTVIGSIGGKTINARCNDLYIDLAEFWKMLPHIQDIALAGGYVNASVDIRGPLADPEFFGTARTSSLRIQVPGYITRDIRPIPFTIAIEGNEMKFGPVSAAVGGGAGLVNGWFRFDRWIPNIFSMDINVPRDTPIPFGFDITGFLAHGDASGNLKLSMENLILSIGGDLLATNTEISINSDELTQAQGTELFAGTLTPVAVDLNVSTGPTVEFLWPNSDFPILRATPDMGTKLHVTADSLSGHISLTSDVRIRSGEIFYFERSFYIRSGLLVFRENEMRFEPRLSARAEVRDRNEDGPLTISMIVENAPLMSFTARFESTPSLSQMEIFALLGQNLTGAQVDENTGAIQRAFLSSTTDLLAQFMVVRQLERQIRNFMRLDMFSVRTQALQNAFFMAAGLMQTPVDRIGVGNYFDNTTVFMGKYIGQDLFVQSMLSMRYDANRTDWGGLHIEPDIGVELQSPLFSIRWDFIPAHPENWWVNDNSITLTWSRTF